MNLYCTAKIDDIQGVLDLQGKYQIDSIRTEDKKDGFVTTPFTFHQLEYLVSQEQGLFIAKNDSTIIAYAMAASWEYWKDWPMFQHMIRELPGLSFQDQTLTIENSYQYGPICIERSFRGTGVLENLFEYARKQMAKRFPILITFINKINPRSYEAHTRKLKMETIHEFQFNGNDYYELAYDTSRKLVITK